MKVLSMIFCVVFTIGMVKCDISKKGFNCKNLKKGEFLYKPKFIQDELNIVRNDSLQMEIRKSTKDTVFFKIDWETDCIYKLEYLGKTGEVDDKLESDYKNRVDYVEIISIGENFYTFRFAINSLQNTLANSDTIWIKK